MHRRRVVAGGAAGIAGAAALAAPAVVRAQAPKVAWRCPGSYPKSVDTLWGTQELIARRVAELTDGAFQIQNFGPGEIVPGLQILDGVSRGTVECGFTASLFYFGKDPSLAISAGLPMGLNVRYAWSWLHHNGGRELLREVFADQGVYAIPAGNTGAQMGGWFRKEIKTVADLNGVKFRIAGLGGMVLQRLNVVPQQISPGDIYPALERGTIDAAEYVGPYDDEKLGFYKIAPYYYYPGWQEYSSSIDLLVSLKAWEALPASYKAVLEVACAEAYFWSVGRYDVLNWQGVRKLVASGTQLRPWPREVLTAMYRAAQELYAELGAQNPRVKRIWEQWDKHRLEQIQWFRVAEDSMASFLAAATNPR